MGAKTRKAVVLAGVACALGLSACQSMGQKQAPEKSEESFDAVTQANLNDRLAQAAERNAKALEELARIERAKTKPAKSPTPKEGLPPELARKADVNWSGPADEFLRQMAAHIGYSFRVQGTSPTQPLMVNVSGDGKRVVEILESAGMELTPRATVVLDPKGQRLFLRYDNAELNGSMTRGGRAQ